MTSDRDIVQMVSMLDDTNKVHLYYDHKVDVAKFWVGDLPECDGVDDEVHEEEKLEEHVQDHAEEDIDEDKMHVVEQHEEDYGCFVVEEDGEYPDDHPVEESQNKEEEVEGGNISYDSEGDEPYRPVPRDSSSNSEEGMDLISEYPLYKGAISIHLLTEIKREHMQDQVGRTWTMKIFKATTQRSLEIMFHLTSRMRGIAH